MFKIDKNTKEIHITRGDIASISIQAIDNDGNNYEFQPGDVVRFNVYKKSDCNSVLLRKDTLVNEVCTEMTINLTKEDTKIGDVILKPTNLYLYEVELNPETAPQTIIGYDDEIGEYKFTLYPEAGDN